jgi:hypothetical protein
MDNGGPAFPDNQQDGMTLRDYFAAQALQGMLAGVPGGHLIPANLAPECYRHADEMLKAREAE